MESKRNSLDSEEGVGVNNINSTPTKMGPRSLPLDRVDRLIFVSNQVPFRVKDLTWLVLFRVLTKPSDPRE